MLYVYVINKNIGFFALPTHLKCVYSSWDVNIYTYVMLRKYTRKVGIKKGSKDQHKK